MTILKFNSQIFTSLESSVYIWITALIFFFLIGGSLGVICVAFFMQGSGIFWSGNTSEPWIILGNNLLGLLTIFVWAGLWSTLIFGSLSAAKILRVDRETEFRGSDLVRDLKTTYLKCLLYKKGQNVAVQGLFCH